MSAAANAQGIQTLLEAEKEAAKVVAKARQCTPRQHVTRIDRVQRLKEAKSEAQKEKAAKRIS
jgi:V-type H+-transporting ATPase subunit G